MQIDQKIIDEILQRADIVDVVGKSLKLKRSGQNYFACCPFHNEKSPSFSVSSVKQIFHCFGCGESGDAIGFTMKYNGLDFIEAIKSLANTYGVHIPEGKSTMSRAQIVERKEHKATLSEAINKTVQFYRNNLINSNLALNYLKNRGLSTEIMDKFCLGYVANESSALARVFPNYTKNQFLVEAGLVNIRDDGAIFDRFRDRVIFPIKNVRGEVIAFGGRIIAKGEPKYLNSPETTIFNKSNELYGLFEAQKSIREHNYVIVVEGYMDVIAMAQFGIDNVVATMGTAATEEHIKKLFRLCDSIYYAFDGDNAGFKAAWRALERSVPLVTDAKTVRFLFLPNEHDPDSFIREFGVATFNEQVKHHSLSMSGFLLKQLSNEVNLTQDEGKAKLISLAKPYIEKVKAVALQVMLKKQLATLVELEPNVLESILNNRSRYAFYTSKWTKDQAYKSQKNNIPIMNTLNLIIQNALLHIDWVNEYCLPEAISHYNRGVQELILLLDYVGNNYSVNDKVDKSSIIENIGFSVIDFARVHQAEVILHISKEEFKYLLDKLLGFSQHKVIKVPKIPMKGR